MRRFHHFLCTLIGISVAFSSSSKADDIITWDFTGTLTQVTDANGVLAANDASLAVGTSFNLLYSFDYNLSPTFPDTTGSSGVTSWWGTDHSSMTLTIGNLVWQTVGPETVDAVYDNEPPSSGGPTQQIDSQFETNSINTNVADPSFGGTSGYYQLLWVLANGATVVLNPAGGPDYFEWTLGPTSFNDLALTPYNFPTSIDLSDWETSGLYLNVSLSGPDGQTAAYLIEGTFSSVSTVPEPQSLLLLAAGLLGIAVIRRRSAIRLI